MIPRAYIQAWSVTAPWPDSRQVEQDLTLENQKISRAMAEQRMLQKLTGSLTEDIAPLLPVGVRFDDEAAIEAFNRIWARLIVKLKGETWKSTENAISELRLKKYPKLLY